MRAYQKENTSRFPDYWNRPVAGSGPSAALTIIGLAPGLHGANKTGIPFTGDASGVLLFKVLEQLGIVDQVRITNAVKCAPPQNKPLTSERRNCQKFLGEELSDAQMSSGSSVLFCLGRIAHEEVLRSLGRNQKEFAFGHGNVHELSDALWLVDTYHCSRYNIQTNRLTEPMFRTAVQCAAKLAQLNYADI
jgi:uracil-DNA glycosylase family 4